MREPSPGFTLIEMLLVISIIVLLMAVLIPEIGAVIQSVRIKDTQQRIALVHQVVEDYKRVYWAYPPSTTPDSRMTSTDADAYPAYYYPNGDEADYLFGRRPDNKHPFGGKFLAYFLMGPKGAGWHRPHNPRDTADPDYRSRFLTAEWDVPGSLAMYLKNAPVSGGNYDSYGPAAPCFVDAFGLEGLSGGLIGYAAANPRASGLARWYRDARGNYNQPFYVAYYLDGCRPVQSHTDRMFEQCPYEFVLLSAGRDHQYGWRIYGKSEGGSITETYADIDYGITDDIANFPLK